MYLPRSSKIGAVTAGSGSPASTIFRRSLDSCGESTPNLSNGKISRAILIPLTLGRLLMTSWIASSEDRGFSRANRKSPAATSDDLPMCLARSTHVHSGDVN